MLSIYFNLQNSERINLREGYAMNLYDELMESVCYTNKNKESIKSSNFKPDYVKNENSAAEYNRPMQEAISVLSEFIRSGMKKSNYTDIVVLNIGDPRVVFDSMGPLAGSRLCEKIHKKSFGITYITEKCDLTYTRKFQGRRFNIKRGIIRPNITIYGTLQKPVNGNNYTSTVDEIKRNNENPFIIATDVFVSNSIKNTGRLFVSPNMIRPGAGLGKDFRPVGDIGILGAIGVDLSTYKAETSDESIFKTWLIQELNRNGHSKIINMMADIVSGAIAYSLISNPREMRMPEVIRHYD